jgi:hypothetical protein
MLYTHCVVCWASLTGPVCINVQRSVCLVLKIVLTLKRFPMCLNFSEVPLTYGIMTVPWYTLSEGRFLAAGFITESTNSFGYSLSVRSCLMFLNSLLKYFWFWHMTFARLAKLWATPPFPSYGWLDNGQCEKASGTLSWSVLDSAS